MTKRSGRTDDPRPSASDSARLAQRQVQRRRLVRPVAPRARHLPLRRLVRHWSSVARCSQKLASVHSPASGRTAAPSGVEPDVLADPASPRPTAGTAWSCARSRSASSRSSVVVVDDQRQPRQPLPEHRRTLARRRAREYCRATATLHVTPALRPAAEQRPVHAPPRRSIAAAFATGFAAIAVTLDDPFTFESFLSLLLGWSFLASGIVAWTRRPENHVGALMVAIGLVWFVSQLLRQWIALGAADGGHLARRPVAAAARVPARRLPAGAPGRAGSTASLVGALAFVMIPLELLWLMFLDFDSLRRARRPAATS